MGIDAYGRDSNCVHVLLMKLMEIEPLKALSPFCSGGQLMQTKTKTKPSQPVSLPFIIVRTTAAALPVSLQNPTSVCVCVFLTIPPSHTVYFTKEAIYDDVREIKLREREANRRRRWKEANFILAGNGWPEGRWCFCIPDARWKMGCRLDLYVSIRGDSGGTGGVPVHG